jgi:hypothetical protein
MARVTDPRGRQRSQGLGRARHFSSESQNQEILGNNPGGVTVKVRRMTKAMTHGLNELKNIEKKQNTSSAHRS